MSQNKWPYFSIALQSRKLLACFDRQTFRDFRIVDAEDSVSLKQDLSVFQKIPSAYYFVSLCDDSMKDFLKPEKSMLRLIVDVKHKSLDLVLFVTGQDKHEACVGFVLSAASVLHASSIPKSTTGLVVDLIEYVKSMNGKISTIKLAQGYIGGFALQKQGRVFGYRNGPIADKLKVREAIKQDPETPIVIRQCGTNELYGHAQILRDYCGVTDYLPIRGRLSHGWQCGSGIIYDDLTHLAPSFVWNRRGYNCLKDMCDVHAIGAPYIYMQEVPDPGPISSSLLAVPIHSLVRNKIETAWNEYAESVVEFAELNKCTSANVMLYCLDFSDELEKLFGKYGIGCISSAEQGDHNFLYKSRSIIRQHETVICNRISTAIFYSLFEVRSTYLWGPIMKTMPRDAYEEVADDKDWVKHYFPSVVAGGLAGVETAKLELGTDCKKSPEDLKNLLYGWLAA